MKKTSAVAVLGLLLLACGRNPEPRGYTLSSDDKDDIASMASAIRDVPVDSIVVEDFTCQMVVPLRGVVYFQPEQIDSDKVVFSRLEFCHTDWPAYASSFANDSGLIVSNGWATSINGLHCDTALVVHFDSGSLFVLYWNHPRKDTMSYYLNRIYNHDYTLPGARGDMPSLFSDPGHRIHYWQYSRSDSTFVQLCYPQSRAKACMHGTMIYCFVEVNGGLAYSGIILIIP
jgi:hypothetical protein